MVAVTKTLSIEVTYVLGRQDPERGVFVGGVPDPPFLDELAIEVALDERYDEGTDSCQPSGKTQLNLRGTKRAYAALAQYLLALCEYESESRDPDYHAHFDEVCDSTGNAAVHLIIHAPSG